MIIIMSNCFLIVWYTVMQKVMLGTYGPVFQGLFVCQGLCRMRKPTGNKQHRAAVEAEWKQEAGFSLLGTG